MYIIKKRRNKQRERKEMSNNIYERTEEMKNQFYFMSYGINGIK